MISGDELQEACLNRDKLIDFLEHIQEILHTNDLVVPRQRGNELAFVPDAMEMKAGKQALLRRTEELIQTLANSMQIQALVPKVKSLAADINLLYPQNESHTSLGFGF